MPGQSGPGSDGNEGVLQIPQSFSVTGTSPSDCLVSYLGHSFGGEGVLPLCREAVGVFYNPSQLDKLKNSLACQNIKLKKKKKKKEGKLKTCTYPNNTKAQLDYILIKQEVL